MDFSYTSPFGPHIRIGLLQHQGTISFSVIGDYTLRGLDSAGEAIPVSSRLGRLEASVDSATPATLVYSLVLSRIPDADHATQQLEKLRTQYPELDCRKLKLGYEFGENGGRAALNTIEHVLCSRGFATEAQANAQRELLSEPDRISILEDRLKPPEGTVVLKGTSKPSKFRTGFRIEPLKPGKGRIVVNDVIVGVGFHWEHRERQKLRGAIEVRIDNRGLLTVINELPLEHYLYSVNSSEMMSVCPEALLKAQTIAARNTLMATMGKHHYSCDFHLCADDHCQCYRGSSRETGFSRRVTLETVGEVLTHNHKICDTRYSKACGGIIESFDSVWHGERVPYMVSDIDAGAASAVNPNYPADNEKSARGLIDSFPDVYCNTASARDVPDYLKYSAKYFRWSVKYSQSQLQGLLNRFPHWSVGEVRNLVPVKRGASGRIEILRIQGSERSVLIKKEYSIRKALSESFLFSSCFYPVIERDERGGLVSVELRGGGWGHGAGLCQIGATMMAVRGKTYPEILAHYYKQTNLDKLWRREVDLEQILAEEAEDDYREGDSCFEFFNCYFVNDCPMIRQGVVLHAANRNGHFVFEPRPQNTVDLRTIGIPCNFMELGSDEATEKGGVKGER